VWLWDHQGTFLNRLELCSRNSGTGGGSDKALLLPALPGGPYQSTAHAVGHAPIVAAAFEPGSFVGRRCGGFFAHWRWQIDNDCVVNLRSALVPVGQGTVCDRARRFAGRGYDSNNLRPIRSSGTVRSRCRPEEERGERKSAGRADVSTNRMDGPRMAGTPLHAAEQPFQSAEAGRALRNRWTRCASLGTVGAGGTASNKMGPRQQTGRFQRGHPDISVQGKEPFVGRTTWNWLVTAPDVLLWGMPPTVGRDPLPRGHIGKNTWALPTLTGSQARVVVAVPTVRSAGAPD